MNSIAFARYELENGAKFSGTAIKLTQSRLHYIYIMLGDNNNWYWVYINTYAFKNQAHFTKTVQLSEFMIFLIWVFRFDKFSSVCIDYLSF